MFIINNLLSLLEKKGLKQADLCEAIGISSSTMTNWKNRGTDPPAKYIIPICEFLDITPYVLLLNKEISSRNELSNDENEMISIYKRLSDINKVRVKERAIVLAELEDSNLEPTHSEHEEQEEPETIFIEFATLKASAGTGEQLIDDPEQDFIEVVKNDTTLQAKFAIQIHGDSMNPEYSNGDIVLVKTQPQINVGQIGIFTVNDMGYIKKLGTDRLVSINPDYDDIYFEEGQEIRCKGLVIGKLEEDDFV